MTIFNALNLIGGLCLFLFGMNLMGQALERRAGSGLRSLLEKMTQNRLMGLLAGLGVTAVIQSSSATTVMVVGFVNSGLMTLRQSIGVIMGANIGTTVTAWILSLSGIEGSSLLVQMFKPSTFTPILALVGIILYMFCKADKKKDTGMILLGFATLMFGMEAMSSAVSSLRNVPQFREIFLMFSNPILGVLVGAVLTGIIQSSSASVGILQARGRSPMVPLSLLLWDRISAPVLQRCFLPLAPIKMPAGQHWSTSTLMSSVQRLVSSCFMSFVPWQLRLCWGRLLASGASQ